MFTIYADCLYLQFCGNLSKVVVATLFNVDFFGKQNCWANLLTPHPLKEAGWKF